MLWQCVNNALLSENIDLCLPPPVTTVRQIVAIATFTEIMKNRKT